MINVKHMITSGCSYSDPINQGNWSVVLGNKLNTSCDHTALSSIGNGLIARKTVYAVHKALKSGLDPKDILVGIMWSGPDRHDIYFQNPNPVRQTSTELWRENPTSFVENDKGGWLIMNPWWEEPRGKIFYKNLHDPINQRILTYENILWVQNYLKNLGIRYFMTKYMMDNRFDNTEYDKNPNISWLKEQVDYSNWLPVNDMYDWMMQHWTVDDFPVFILKDKNGNDYEWQDHHPLPHMSSKFVDDIILPFLEKMANGEKND